MDTLPSPPDRKPLPQWSIGDGPVETTVGEAMRQRALLVLQADYLKMADRAKRRMPTDYERAQLARCEAALAELQAMAPSGDLVPSRAKGWLD